jgi:cobalamin biosynthesis Mg chelatase CobN
MSYESVPLRRYPSTDEDVLEQSGTQANAATNTATDHQSLADSTNTSTNSQPRADSTNTATDHQSLADSTSVDHNAQNAQCPAPQSTSSTLKRWLAELSAWITGLIALAAIIITIGLHNGRPLPDWPYSISVNALVSIFATILKAMMMVPIAEGKFYHNLRA